VTKLLTSTWMTVFIGALVYLLATVAFWTTPLPPVNPELRERAAARAVQTGPSWNFQNPEADQLMQELKAEKKVLQQKEQQLNDLAVRLDAERAEVNQATQSVRQLQIDFDKNVLRVKDDEAVNLKKLAKVYAAMSGEGAAGILAEMDDNAVARIMAFMREGETAVILEAMAKKPGIDPKRVALISDRLRLSTVRNSTPK
jgi:flagellar motility protein MotE (MotC chaperone)